MWKWLRWLGRNWDYVGIWIAGALLIAGQEEIALVLYVIIFAYPIYYFGRRLWRMLIFSPPVWWVRMRLLRPLGKRLHWIFGKKYYWVHRGGIVKVVVTERESDTLWSAMEYRPDLKDKLFLFNRFCSSSSVFFDNVEDASRELVRIQRREYDSAEEYWKRKLEEVQTCQNAHQ